VKVSDPIYGRIATKKELLCNQLDILLVLFLSFLFPTSWFPTDQLDTSFQAKMAFSNGIVAMPLYVDCYYLLLVRLASLKTELLSLLSKDFPTIIGDHVGWSLTGNRKQKNVKLLA